MFKQILKINFLGVVYLIVFSAPLYAGPYLSSSHGNTTYGVSRPDMATAGYSRANCTHCHEQHASVNGAEPAPNTGDAGGPDEALLFDLANTSQAANFCFHCHGVSAPAYQTGGFVTNRSYSYRAGGWTADTLSNVEDAFAQTSSHNLADITTFAAGKAWNFSATSNACGVCHDPHVVQGDPANYPVTGSSAKTAGTRGWLTTRPSEHPTTNLWGDGAGEKMSDYTASYQAPLRFASPYPAGAIYEPDGSATTNGSNLTDINTFCLDCHANEVASTGTTSFNPGTTGGKLSAINWATGDRHGKTTSAETINLISPYTSNTSYVLSCTDCHEPHGSPSLTLTRREVNNGTVLATGAAQETGNTQWASLCERCHGNAAAVGAAHHATDIPGCSCHGSPMYDPCTDCHYHGAVYTYNAYTNRPVF